MKKLAIIGFGGAGYNAARAVRQRDCEAVIDVYSDTDTAPGNPTPPTPPTERLCDPKAMGLSSV